MSDRVSGLRSPPNAVANDVRGAVPAESCAAINTPNTTTTEAPAAANTRLAPAVSSDTTSGSSPSARIAPQIDQRRDRDRGNCDQRATPRAGRIVAPCSRTRQPGRDDRGGNLRFSNIGEQHENRRTAAGKQQRRRTARCVGFFLEQPRSNAEQERDAGRDTHPEECLNCGVRRGHNAGAGQRPDPRPRERGKEQPPGSPKADGWQESREDDACRRRESRGVTPPRQSGERRG